jgi:hypothetical protein
MCVCVSGCHWLPSFKNIYLYVKTAICRWENGSELGFKDYVYRYTLPLSLCEMYIRGEMDLSIPFQPFDVFTGPRDCTSRAPDPRIECANLHGLTLFKHSNGRSSRQ